MFKMNKEQMSQNVLISIYNSVFSNTLFLI